jgi:hypothetical protein
MLLHIRKRISNFANQKYLKQNAMELTIDLIDKKAINLLDSMEKMHLIRLLPQKQNIKPSERFAGKLNLTDREYSDFQNYIKQSRAEIDL